MNGVDRLAAGLLIVLLTGTILAFGGRVWWGPFALAVLSTLVAAACLARMLLDGNMRLIASPLTFLGVLGLGIAALQVAPLPAAVSARLSWNSRAAYTQGVLPERARALDPSLELPEATQSRSPVSLDRPATLRWMMTATACLMVFWGVSQFTDRLERLFLVWGSVIVGFFVNTAIAVVQLSCGSRGLYGFIQPGKGPVWAPNWNDLLQSPGASVLRIFGEERTGHPAWALPFPDMPFFIGTQMGGSGAYLALAAVAMPLALAITLQLLAPRGSREPLSSRLLNSGRGSLVVLLIGMLLTSSMVLGFLAGPVFSIPFAATLILAGLPAAWMTGLRGVAVSLTSLTVISLAGGAAVGAVWAEAKAWPSPVLPESATTTLRMWRDAAPIVRDFPLVGAGLGSFSAIYPYYKTQDGSATTAMSSLLQCGVEAGGAGLALVAWGAFWCSRRLSRAVKRVGTADRALVFGLMGAVAGFTLFSVVHWTVELPSVALAASALGGTCNRWLAGGTDLFVERG